MVHVRFQSIQGIHSPLLECCVTQHADSCQIIKFDLYRSIEVDGLRLKMKSLGADCDQGEINRNNSLYFSGALSSPSAHILSLFHQREESPSYEGLMPVSLPTMPEILPL